MSISWHFAEIITYLWGLGWYRVNGSISWPMTVNHGVPQGSDVDPILFLVWMLLTDWAIWYYLQTIWPYILEEEHLKWSLLKVLEYSRKQMTGLHKINDWINLKWKKTQKLTCCLCRLNNKIHREVKLLGFYLNPTLTWRHPVENTCVKLSRVIYLLMKLKKVLTYKFLLSVYHVMFHCHLKYSVDLKGCYDILQNGTANHITRRLKWPLQTYFQNL